MGLPAETLSLKQLAEFLKVLSIPLNIRPKTLKSVSAHDGWHCDLLTYNNHC